MRGLSLKSQRRPFVVSRSCQPNDGDDGQDWGHQRQPKPTHTEDWTGGSLRVTVCPKTVSNASSRTNASTLMTMATTRIQRMVSGVMGSSLFHLVSGRRPAHLTFVNHSVTVNPSLECTFRGNRERLHHVFARQDRCRSRLEVLRLCPLLLILRLSVPVGRYEGEILVHDL